MNGPIPIILMMAVFVFVIIILVIGHKRNNALLANGDIKKRPKGWEDQNTIFTTAIDSIDKIYQAMNLDSVQEGAVIESSRNSNGSYVFRLIGGPNSIRDRINERRTLIWEVSLAPLPQTGSAHQYLFSFQNLSTLNGVTQGITPLNVLLTQIEKAVLTLDPEAEVQRIKAEYTTSSNSRWTVGK